MKSGEQCQRGKAKGKEGQEMKDVSANKEWKRIIGYILQSNSAFIITNSDRTAHQF